MMFHFLHELRMYNRATNIEKNYRKIAITTSPSSGILQMENLHTIAKNINFVSFFLQCYILFDNTVIELA